MRAVARIMQVCYVAKGYSDAVPVFSDDQHSNIYSAWNVGYAKSMDISMKKSLEAHAGGRENTGWD